MRVIFRGSIARQAESVIMKKFLLAAVLSSITFGWSANAAAACVTQTINIGETKSAALATDDCIDNNANGQKYYYDYFEFSATSGQQISIQNSSSALDPDLMLINPDGSYVYDDNSGGGTAARIPASGFLTLAASGKYAIAASSAVPQQTGAYTLTLSSNVATPGTGAGTPVVEFYNSNLKHYFMTGDSQEAAGIDSGAAGAGWARTGYSFNAWRTQSEAVAGAKSVCRFYGTPGKGPNSHFYTADAGECALVKNDPGWFYEGIALYSQGMQYGSCQKGTAPVYRVYNNRWMYNDSNHRFVTGSLEFQKMVQQGWVGEGLVMCAISADAPAPAGTPITIGTNGGNVSLGSLILGIPPGTFPAPTAVTPSAGTTTGDYPDATVVSDVYTVDMASENLQTMTVQMSAKGAINGPVFGVLVSDIYGAHSAVPEFRARIVDAKLNGGLLTFDIPPSALAAASDGRSADGASVAADKIGRRFTIWFITGYSLKQSDHFYLYYSPKSCNSTVMTDYLDDAENAYKRLITDLKFSPSGLSWPMTIDVAKLDDETFGEAGYGRVGRYVRGTKSLSLSVNQKYCASTAQKDLDEMKVTLGHEFFHTLQYVYDPHWAAREAIFGSPFTWLYEASSTWFEGEMAGSSTYSSVVFSQNLEYYRNGLEHGAEADAKNHGYGASSFLRFLTSRYGNSLMTTIWSNVSAQSGTYSSTGAIATALTGKSTLSAEWQLFAEQYITGTTAFGWNAPASSYKYVYDEKKPSTEFNDDLYALSGVKILLDFTPLKTTKKYTLTVAEGKNTFIKAYLYKSKTKVAEFTDKYSFDVAPGSGYVLVVANSNDAAPYLTMTHLKIKLEGGPSIDSISPVKGPVDTLVTINGSGFGTSTDTRAVYFNGVKAATVTWTSDTLATAKVPPNSSTGDVVVEVNSAKSNGVNFEVVAQCSATQNAGNDTPDTRTIELGKPAGSFVFAYETYSQKDQILVRYQGGTLFDTGCVGANGSKTLSYSGTSTQISVQVIPNCAGGTGTAWNYSVSCP